MADFSLPNDEIVTIQLDFTDVAGKVKPPAGGTVTSSDPTIATVTLAADGGSVDITPVADGVGVSITYANPNIPNLPAIVLMVDVVEPTPTSDAFDLSSATFRPKGT